MASSGRFEDTEEGGKTLKGMEEFWGEN